MDREFSIETRFGSFGFDDLLKELRGPERVTRRRKVSGKFGEPISKGQLRFRKRRSKPCASCGDHRWSIVRDHASYRDPFLSCQSCHSTYRMDRTPLDIQFAWRDGIPMPDEVNHSHAHHPLDPSI